MTPHHGDDEMEIERKHNHHHIIPGSMGKVGEER